jgi:endonuclease/exonuclease/phosphatase family metal-dependent hydrolase
LSSHRQLGQLFVIYVTYRWAAIGVLFFNIWRGAGYAAELGVADGHAFIVTVRVRNSRYCLSGQMSAHCQALWTMATMELTLLEWNVWYRQPIEPVADLIVDLDPDIVCLCELSVGYSDQQVYDTPAYIAECLGYNAHVAHMPVVGSDGKAFDLANAIYSRYPIVGKRTVAINEPTGSGGYDDEYRTYIEAVVDLGDSHLRVGCTHMSYTDRFEDTARKRAEADRLIRAIGSGTDPVVVAGDFNALGSSYTMDCLSALLIDAGPGEEHATWTTKPFEHAGFVANSLGWRLDRVFVSSEIAPLAAEVVPTACSDHLPILVRLSI